eukprot:176481-Rhodomonas_salina.1
MMCHPCAMTNSFDSTTTKSPPNKPPHPRQLSYTCYDRRQYNDNVWYYTKLYREGIKVNDRNNAQRAAYAAVFYVTDPKHKHGQ